MADEEAERAPHEEPDEEKPFWRTFWEVTEDECKHLDGGSDGGEGGGGGGGGDGLPPPSGPPRDPWAAPMPWGDISEYAQYEADERFLQLLPSCSSTADGEAELFRECVSWNVDLETPHRIVAIDPGSGSIAGASYYDVEQPVALLSALAVAPKWRNWRLGKLLIVATLGHMQRSGCAGARLQVRECDASPERHGLYTSCGFEGGDPSAGGEYTLAPIPEDIEERVMQTEPREGWPKPESEQLPPRPPDPDPATAWYNAHYKTSKWA